MKHLDINKIKVMAEENTTAEAVFQELAQRERARKKTDLKRLQAMLITEGFRVVPEEFVDLFEKLADSGVGEIIKGKNGEPTTFKWHYNLKDIGKAALKGSKAVTKDVPPPVQDVPQEIHGVFRSNGGDKKSITVMYGFNRKANITLPANINRSEIKDLIEILLKETSS